VPHASCGRLTPFHFKVYPGRSYAIIWVELGPASTTLLPHYRGLSIFRPSGRGPAGRALPHLLRQSADASPGRHLGPRPEAVRSLSLEETWRSERPTPRPGSWNIRRGYQLVDGCRPAETSAPLSLFRAEQQMVAIGRPLVANPPGALLERLSLGLAPVVSSGSNACCRRILQTALTGAVEQSGQAREWRRKSPLPVVEGRTTAGGQAAEVTRDKVEAAYFGCRLDTRPTR